VDDARERAAPVGFDDGGAGIVTRGLDGEDHLLAVSNQP
jgi:hypothetical protein